MSSLALLKSTQEDQIPLYEPALVLYEVTSALYRKQSEGEITENEVEGLMEHFFQLPILFQWQLGLLKKASQIAAELSLKKVYDCTYLAIALSRGIPLITVDEELIKKGRKIFEKIFTPEEFRTSTSQ